MNQFYYTDVTSTLLSNSDSMFSFNDNLSESSYGAEGAAGNSTTETIVTEESSNPILDNLFDFILNEKNHVAAMNGIIFLIQLGCMDIALDLGGTERIVRFIRSLLSRDSNE
jgi:hypothetical protein